MILKLSCCFSQFEPEASSSSSKPVPEVKDDPPSTSKLELKIEDPANESEKYDILTTLEGAAFQSRLVSL